MDYSIKILGGGNEVGRAGIEISNSSESLILDYGVNFNQKDEPNFPFRSHLPRLRDSWSHMPTWTTLGPYPFTRYPVVNRFTELGSRSTLLS